MVTELLEVEQSHFRRDCHIIESDSVVNAVIAFLSRFIRIFALLGLVSGKAMRRFGTRLALWSSWVKIYSRSSIFKSPVGKPASFRVLSTILLL